MACEGASERRAVTKLTELSEAISGLKESGAGTLDGEVACG